MGNRNTLAESRLQRARRPFVGFHLTDYRDLDTLHFWLDLTGETTTELMRRALATELQRLATEYGLETP
jgi:hypothetical protein